MITLYQFSTSPFAEKVRRALNYKGLDFEIREVGRAKVAQGDYGHVSPTGKFPAIQDGDTAVWDSTDILYHLEAAHGGPSLIPAVARDAALAHAIEEWADERRPGTAQASGVNATGMRITALNQMLGSIVSSPSGRMSGMRVTISFRSAASW